MTRQRRVRAFPKSNDTSFKMEDSRTLKSLESAWNNLPSDFSPEERYIFLEIAGKIVKLYKKLEKLQLQEEILTKN